MKFGEILNEQRKIEKYHIVRYRGKYRVKSKDGKMIGEYGDQKKAVQTILTMTSKAFNKASFYKKEAMIKKYIESKKK